MQPKRQGKIISIVIPVYNVESYISQCLDSIVNQSYRNLEIILIDDGSTDRSGEICDKYAAKDARIIVKHQKNGGAANAKNAALKIASGDYLAFVDSDDYVEPDAYDYMISILEEYDADVIQGSFRYIYKNKKEDYPATDKNMEYGTIEYLKKYTENWTCALLWDKLYKRSLFQDIFFEEGHVVDDEFFTYQGMMNARKIICVPEIVYNYRKRKSSVTSNPDYQSRIIFDKLDYLEKRRTIITGKYLELKRVFDRHYLEMLLLLVSEPFVTDEGIIMIKKMIGSYLREEKHNDIPFRLKLNLLKIRFGSVKHLLKNRKQVACEKQTIMDYFE